MAHLIVRRAAPADSVQMAALAQAAYAKYVPRIDRPPAPMVADYETVASSQHAWVIDRDGEVVGMLELEPQRDHLLLLNVAVAPSRQGAGLGRLLLDLAESEAVRLGLPEVRLYTNEAMVENLAYYTRRGYTETDRRAEGGFQRVFFTKRFEPRDRGPARG